MKWLATFLCLLPLPALAETQFIQQPQGQALPLVTICSTTPPENALAENYGEIPFVEGEGNLFIPGGRMITGKITMFLNPDGSSYTVMLNLGDDLHCMIITGKNLGPALGGEKL